MAKTINSMFLEAEALRDMWMEISEDPQALRDRNKTKSQAIALYCYFEGQCDALVEVARLLYSL